MRSTIASIRILSARRIALAACFCLGILLMHGCTTTPTDSGNNNQGEKLTSPYYIQANINGKVETMQEFQLGTTRTYQTNFSSGGNGSGTGYLLIQGYSFGRQQVIGGLPIIDTAYRSVQINVIRTFSQQPFGAQRDSLITRPTMSYGNSDQEINGVEILWRDAAGKMWSTSQGSGDQTGSTFTITEHTLIQYQIGQPIGGRYKTVGTFNCKLYDGQGNSMNVTDGKFSLQTVFE